MGCLYHPDRPKTAQCYKCRAELCTTCAIELKAGRPWSQRILDKAAYRLRRPAEQTPEALLGQVYYLRDDYQRAAPLLRAGWAAQAKKLESFGTAKPYRIEGGAEDVPIKFIKTDPLPIVQVCVNGGDPVNFFIDTCEPTMHVACSSASASCM